MHVPALYELHPETCQWIFIISLAKGLLDKSTVIFFTFKSSRKFEVPFGLVRRNYGPPELLLSMYPFSGFGTYLDEVLFSETYD